MSCDRSFVRLCQAWATKVMVAIASLRAGAEKAVGAAAGVTAAITAAVTTAIAVARPWIADPAAAALVGKPLPKPRRMHQRRTDRTTIKRPHAPKICNRRRKVSEKLQPAGAFQPAFFRVLLGWLGGSRCCILRRETELLFQLANFVVEFGALHAPARKLHLQIASVGLHLLAPALITF